LNATSVFFQNNVMLEVACESNGKCNNDQMSFKAYLSRWLAATTKMAPFTYDTIMPLLQSSATAAAEQCSGGDTGRVCGLRWTMGSTWDGTYGVGQQMSALEVIQSNLISKVAGPVTNSTGGTSQGNPAAGGGKADSSTGQILPDATTGDKVGAGFLTTIVLIGVLGGAWWMVA
jgi:mannan endo-1,6-alpha-mannosidase